VSLAPDHFWSRLAVCHHTVVPANTKALGVKTYQQLAELQPLVGRVIGTGEWLTIDQTRIDQFAAVTGDDQWIHVDPVRATQGVFGTTVAHGFLTLSLLPYLSRSSFGLGGIRMTVNYGLNRVRFPAPVPVNSRVRARHKLLSYEPIDGGVQVVCEVSVEREGHPKPVCVAESVARHYL
jgi:acyl dehydratase